MDKKRQQTNKRRHTQKKKEKTDRQIKDRQLREIIEG